MYYARALAFERLALLLTFPGLTPAALEPRYMEFVRATCVCAGVFVCVYFQIENAWVVLELNL